MAGGSFPDFVEQVRLIDHHVHGAFHADGDETRFQNSLNEGNTEPLANPEDTYNTQIGLAIRRWRTGILDLPRHTSPTDYWSRCSDLGELEVSRRMTRAAGVSDWLIDTGLDGADYLGKAGMADVSGGRTHETVRLERVAESVIREIADPADYVDLGARLWRTAITKVVGRWIDDDCSEADARKIVQLVAHDNARRVYAHP